MHNAIYTTDPATGEIVTLSELAKRHGFHVSSISVRYHDGKPLAKHKQVRLIGNSVCPPLARAIVEANFTHEQRYMPLSEVA